MTADELAEALGRAVASLRQARPSEALPVLHRIAHDPDLLAAGDLADVRARVFSLLAQALLETGDLDGASSWVRQALRQVRPLGDTHGLSAVRALQSEILGAIVGERERRDRRLAMAALAEVPLAEVVAGGDLERIVQKANAEVEAGRPEVAAEAARIAVEWATERGSVRDEVLARLSLARAVPALARDEILAAYGVAERASEPVLVGAVARAAAASDVDLPVQVGPETTT